jgi:hypothetical protein
MLEHFTEVVIAPTRESELRIRSLDLVVEMVFFEAQRETAEKWVEYCKGPQPREIYRLIVVEAQSDEVRRSLLLPGPLDHRAYHWPPEIVQRPTPYMRIHALWNSGATVFEADEIESSLTRSRLRVAETYKAFGIVPDQDNL